MPKGTPSKSEKPKAPKIPYQVQDAALMALRNEQYAKERKEYEVKMAKYKADQELRKNERRKKGKEAPPTQITPRTRKAAAAVETDAARSAESAAHSSKKRKAARELGMGADGKGAARPKAGQAALMLAALAARLSAMLSLILIPAPSLTHPLSPAPHAVGPA